MSKILFITVKKYIENNNYILLTNECDYKNVNTKLNIECLKCKYIFHPTFHNFKNKKTNCPLCAGNLKWNNKRFIEQSKLLFGNKFDYSKLSEIKNKKTRIQLLCKDCNYLWITSVESHLNSKIGCPKCANNIKLSFKNILHYIENNNDKLLTNNSEYKNNKSQLKIECHKCKYIFKTNINRYKDLSNRCPKCCNKLKITYNIIYNYIKETNNILLTKECEYKDTHSKLKISCCKCNNIYYPSFNNFKHNHTRCPFCKISHGEQIIEKY